MKLKPQVPGWELIENAPKSVIYECKALSRKLILEKISGIWYIDSLIEGRSIILKSRPTKEKAVSLAKEYMRNYPVLPEMRPVYEEGEEIPPLKSKGFKNPRRVTQFSRHR